MLTLSKICPFISGLLARDFAIFHLTHVALSETFRQKHLIHF